MDIVDRFVKYISYDTQSDESSESVPSTQGQVDFGKILVEDMKEIGFEDVYQDDKGYVYGSIKSNVDKDLATIGFIAHMDTAPDLDGECKNPNVFTYQGGDIKLNDQYTIKVQDFPYLKDLEGKELVTTDGTTLLGADDKAGICEIFDACQYIIENDVDHGDIKVAITPDEEIGRGADHFDVDGFDADFAYTMDGGEIGELQYENFNAASCKVSIRGNNVHPGSAKGVMVNALRIGIELDSMLPVNEKPEYTDGYEGFYMLDKIEGNPDHCELAYIIRDHSMEKFEEKKELFQKIVDFLNEKYGNILDLEIADSYYNMKEKILPHMEIVELAKKSMEDIGIEPKIFPIRGGTDGASLSYKGLLCPNIFAGGMNMHGRFELVPTEWMRKASSLIVQIVKNNVNR